MITAPLRALARGFRERKLRAEVLLDQAIGCYRVSEDQLHAYMTWTPDRAMVSAKAADHLFAAGIDLGPMQGIPVSVKDVYGLEGLPTFAGSSRALPPSFSNEGTLILFIEGIRGAAKR
jgi:aspartyl-tRNA(Asn)/glutamyl-tRNA(Gln) amidotransferase subunit A